MKPEDFRLRYYGDPVLRQRATKVTVIDEMTRRQAERMFELMYEYEGIGLAANQVGMLRRMVVLDVPLDEEKRAVLVLINPTILEKSGKESGEEGCLSIPEVRAEVSRATKVAVRAQDLKGETFEFEAEGLLAVAVQHEVDHLDGVLFVDRLNSVRRKLLEGRLKQIAQEYASPA